MEGRGTYRNLQLQTSAPTGRFTTPPASESSELKEGEGKKWSKPRNPLLLIEERGVPQGPYVVTCLQGDKAKGRYKLKARAHPKLPAGLTSPGHLQEKGKAKDGTPSIAEGIQCPSGTHQSPGHLQKDESKDDTLQKPKGIRCSYVVHLPGPLAKDEAEDSTLKKLEGIQCSRGARPRRLVIVKRRSRGQRTLIKGGIRCTYRVHQLESLTKKNKAKDSAFSITEGIQCAL